MNYRTDFTISNNADEFKILKDSVIEEDNGIMTQTMTLIYGNQTYKSEALKTSYSFTDGKYYTYPISGKQTIDNEFYTVDSTYDASKTPMVMDDNGNTDKGGKYKYINSKNHHITIEAIEKNKIQISVDNDGDGKADQAEVVLI